MLFQPCDAPDVDLGTEDRGHSLGAYQVQCGGVLLNIARLSSCLQEAKARQGWGYKWGAEGDL